MAARPRPDLQDDRSHLVELDTAERDAYLAARCRGMIRVSDRDAS